MTDPRKEFWTAKDVMYQLGISRPTAYRLMNESGALVGVPRRKRVLKSAFISYLRENGGDKYASQ